MKHVLIIEGDPRISVALEARLLQFGFRSFEKVATEEDAVAAAIRHGPNLVVVGDRLRAGSSINAARRIAERQDVSMLMVNDRAGREMAPPPPDASLSGPYELDDLGNAIEAAEQPRAVQAAA
jgi:DNA-binding response OmpR family regulator